MHYIEQFGSQYQFLGEITQERSKQIIKAMGIPQIQYELIDERIINQKKIIQFSSSPLYIQNKNLFSYRTHWTYQLFSNQVYVNLKIKLTDFYINHASRIEFGNYHELIQMLTKQINSRLTGSLGSIRRISYFLSQSFFQVMYMRMPMPNKFQKMHIYQIYDDIQVEIIDLFFNNFMFHNLLSKQNSTNLFVFRAINEFYKQFQEQNRIKSIEQQKTKNSISDHSEIVMKVMEIIQCSPRSTYLFKKQKVKQKFQVFIRNLRNITSQPAQIDINAPIEKDNLYKIALRDLKQIQLNNLQNIRTNFSNSLQSKRNQICQGIKVSKKEQLKAHGKRQTNYSSVQLICCQFQYQISIFDHDYKQKPNHFYKKIQEHQILQQEQRMGNEFIDYEHRKQINEMHNEQKLKQNQNYSPQSQIISQNKEDQKQIKKLLVEKICLKQKISSKESFINEYNFIKKIRGHVFPYIAKYYLETTRSDESEYYKRQRNKYKNNQIQKKAQSKKYKNAINEIQNNEKCGKVDQKLFYLKMLKNITQTSIYLDFYENSLFKFTINQQLRKISISTINSFLFQISQTLKFLSDRGISHRDIKPSNIMIDSYMRVRFIDWGSCCNIYSENQKNQGYLQFQQFPQNLKTTIPYSQPYNDYMQKVGFLSKEAFEKGKYFDIYSFGSIIKVFVDAIKSLYNQNQFQKFWLLDQLLYVSMKCLEVNPQDRLSALNLCIYFNELSKILLEKNRIISSEQYLMMSFDE